MDGATPSEIAGFCVGGLLVAAAVSAPRVDLFIAQGQRRTLGLCVSCGGLHRVHCSKCRGRGSLTPGWDLMSILPRFWGEDEVTSAPSLPCKSCSGKGHFPCPSCSDIKISQ